MFAATPFFSSIIAFATPESNLMLSEFMTGCSSLKFFVRCCCALLSVNSWVEGKILNLCNISAIRNPFAKSGSMAFTLRERAKSSLIHRKSAAMVSV